MSDIQNLNDIIASGNLEKALRILSEAIADAPADDSLLFMRGKLYWRLGQRPEATSDFLAAVELNPASPAARALEHAREVESFFNPDLYNP